MLSETAKQKMIMNRFYITTPLYYVNDKPHLGTAYSTVLADVLNRYHQLVGYETFFLTGVDEHGQKVSQAAKQQNIPVQTYCDQMSKRFETVWKLMDISYNRFFRTTAKWHKKAVQKFLQELHDKKQIYESTYEGWYCVSEETFYTSKDLINGKSPSGKEVIKIKEKNYFFKMSSYQKPLLEYIDENPDFIQPPHRKNEVISFLKQGLSDLCISRPKSRVNWGVEIPFDTDYVTYVWVDALLNYITGVGWPPQSGGGRKQFSFTNPLKSEDFEKWWKETGAVHLIGKDILITHCVYWPCLLMALGIKLPKTILAHGWLLNQSQEKMSKSKGDVMDPLKILNKSSAEKSSKKLSSGTGKSNPKNNIQFFDSDSLRYFLIRDVPLGNDSPVSHTLIANRINEDLANNFGNLISRTTKMIHQGFESKIPERNCKTSKNPLIENLRHKGIEVTTELKANLLRPHLILENIINLLNETNRFLEKSAPWKTIKTNKQDTGAVLRSALEIIYLSAVLLKPVMPKKMDQLLKSLACPDEWPVENFQSGFFPKAGETIQEFPPLFPRIN